MDFLGRNYVEISRGSTRLTTGEIGGIVVEKVFVRNSGMALQKIFW